MADQKELFKWDSGQAQSGDFSTDLRTSQGLSIGSLTYDPAIGEIYATGPIAGTMLTVSGDGSGYGLHIGTDTNLYRANTNILGTDDSLRIAIGLVVGNTTTTPLADQILADGLISGLELVGTGQGATYGLTIGTDVQLYRGAANIWDTPDSLRIGVGLVVGDNTTTPLTDQIIAAGAIQGLELIGTGQGVTYGLTLGTDTQIYRGAANVLDTPDSLRIGVGLVVGDNTTAAVAGKVIADFAAFTTDGSGGGIAIGTDTQIYRGAANIIDTPDSVRIATGLVVGNLTDTPVSTEIHAVGDIFAAGDAGGFKNRISRATPALSVLQHFDGTSRPSGWSVAGSPFVTPYSEVYSRSVLTLNNPATAYSRCFIYKTFTGSGGLIYFHTGLVSNLYETFGGLRLDDGTDNNYVECGVWHNNGTVPNTMNWTVISRLGGGTVTYSHAVGLPMSDWGIQFQVQGTVWTNWSTAIWAFQPMGYGMVYTTVGASGLNFTPTRIGYTMRKGNSGSTWYTGYADYIGGDI